MKVLLVEDEPALARSVIEFLKADGYICEVAPTFNKAIEKVVIYQYDCFLVDITLPDGNGLDLIVTIKQHQPNAGIIITSAKNALDDRIHGLNLGADDYLPKPFHLTELNARIKSVLRRRQFEGKKEIEFNEIKIRFDEKKVFANKVEIVLTKKEFELLVFLIVNKNKVIKKESIAEHLWGDIMDMADNYDFIYSHIKNLRKKLVEAGSVDYLQTVYGMGYKFTDTNI